MKKTFAAILFVLFFVFNGHAANSPFRLVQQVVDENADGSEVRSLIATYTWDDGNLVRAVSGRRWSRVFLWAVVEGIALWGTGHTDLQFPIFVAFILVPYGLWTLWQTRPKALPERLTTALPIRRRKQALLGEASSS